jgi:hypothetical protein
VIGRCFPRVRYMRERYEVPNGARWPLITAYVHRFLDAMRQLLLMMLNLRRLSNDKG